MHVADVHSASNETSAFIFLLGITHFVLTFKCAYNVAQQTPNKTQPAIANLTQKQRGVMLGTLLKELLPEQLGLSLRPVDSLTRLIC